MGGKKPLRRPLWPPTRATASNYYPLGLDGAGGAAKPLLRAPKKPAPLHGRLPAFSGAVDAFERARKCFLEWRYFFSIILSEFLKNRVALQLHCIAFGLQKKRVLPAPEPPQTKILRFRRCFFPSRPMRTFWVSSLFSDGSLSRYFLFSASALPHFAEPCSSRLR